MDSALAEFSRQGYGASSINAICSGQDISKGIVYHYFETKDDLYLACVKECFDLLTEHIRDSMDIKCGGVTDQLEKYFNIRMEFFNAHPVYRRIFCEAVVAPPAHLNSDIQTRREGFDTLNIQILERLLSQVPLRRSITMDEVIEIFRQFQDFINIRYQMSVGDCIKFEAHEKRCRNALNVLLYGVIERKDTENV